MRFYSMDLNSITNQSWLIMTAAISKTKISLQLNMLECIFFTQSTLSINVVMRHYKIPKFYCYKPWSLNHTPYHLCLWYIVYQWNMNMLLLWVTLTDVTLFCCDLLPVQTSGFILGNNMVKINLWCNMTT